MIPRKHKVKTKDFSFFKKGKTASSPHLSLVVFPFAGDYNKVSFVVSKKIHKNSTKRNKIKRRGYHVVRDISQKIKKNAAYVFYFKKGADTLSYREIKKEILFLLRKAGAL